MYCSSCGTQFQEGDSFCPQCGEARTKQVARAKAGAQPVIVNVHTSSISNGRDIDDMNVRPNAMAITSMWLGIGGLVLIALFGLGGLLSLCAVILGHVSSVRIKRNGEQGGAFATTGLVLGYIGCAICAIVVIIIFGIAAYFVTAANENSTVTY